jgi:hypothetical protein
MRIARNRCVLAIAVVTVGLGQSAIFSGTARAGFFDFLFGPPPQAPAARGYEPYPPHMRAPRYPLRWRAFRKHQHREHQFTARRTLIVANIAEHPGRLGGPVDLMEDESLRKGDAVMMPGGIRIFVGYPGSPHTPEDFRKPADVNGLSKRERKAFAGLDAQDTDSAGKSVMTSGRSAQQLKEGVGKTITDPKGRLIRYVGP